MCIEVCFFFDWLSFLLFDWYHFVQTNTQTESKLVSWIIVSTMGALTPIFLRQKVCILRIVFNHFMVTMIVCTLHRSFPSLSSFSSLYRSHFKSKANTDFQYKVFQCNRIVNILFWNKLNCVCELLVTSGSEAMYGLVYVFWENSLQTSFKSVRNLSKIKYGHSILVWCESKFVHSKNVRINTLYNGLEFLH